MKKILLILLPLLISCKPQYDICVYGATASGVMAAIQAARMGQKTVLIANDSHVGGVATSGLTATDMNRHAVVGGLAEEFYKEIYKYYLNPDVWTCQTRDEFMVSTLKRTYTGKNDPRQIQWVYESKVAENIMKTMLEEAGVKVLYNSRIDRNQAINKKGSDIQSITLTNNQIIKAKVFIDSSYEGDLMAEAGVSYMVGRESKEQYGESLAGIRKFSTIKGSPYLENGDLIPYLAPEMYGEEGAADNRTQAYCYRVTLTDNPDNMVPITMPNNYDPRLYEVVLRKITEATLLKDIITFTPMPNRKTDTNHLDFFGASFEYPEASYEKRAEIADLHRLYAHGMLYFLGHDERVPLSLREEMQRWGWAADEFTDNGNFPHQLYVREARRMIGEYVMTQENVQKNNAEHSIGMGSYAMDCHFVSYVADGEDIAIEGGIFTATKPYSISYYSLVPKKEECSNLLVSVCLSASHVAYASIRMEPVYMVLGQSAAVAAVEAITTRKAVQDIDYQTLENKLNKLGQILR